MNLLGYGVEALVSPIFGYTYQSYKIAWFIGLFFLFIIFLNRIRPRFWCRVLCPLGALLGIFSMFSPLGLKKDDETEKFEILLKGAGNLANFVMFRRMLSTIEGVKFVQVKALKSDKATISVDFIGTTQELAAALMLKAFESFGINIYDVSDNQLKIELIGSQSQLDQ